MTANQVNNAMANETYRHDIATEDLNAKYYELEERKLDLQDQWKRTDQSIQQEYNQAYIAYLNASQEEKQWYEGQLAQIQEKRTLYEHDHNVEMESIAKQQQEELERSNVTNEGIRSTLAALQEKELEYKSTALRLESTLKEQQMAQDRLKAVESFQLEQQKLLQGYEIENTRMSNELVKTQAALKESEARINLMDAQKAATLTNAGSNMATSMLQSIISGLFHRR